MMFFQGKAKMGEGGTKRAGVAHKHHLKSSRRGFEGSADAVIISLRIPEGMSLLDHNESHFDGWRDTHEQNVIDIEGFISSINPMGFIT